MVAFARDSWLHELHQPGGVIEVKPGGVPIRVPETLRENLKFRRALNVRGDESPKNQHQLRALCADVQPDGKPGFDGLLFWVSCFAWTYVPKVPAGTGWRNLTGAAVHRPLIPWPSQVTALRHLHNSIVNGGDLAFEKSRRQGATWIIIAAFQWAWQFHHGLQFMEMSRKEALVDRKGDPTSLLGMHDYLIKHQAPWMMPAKWSRSKLSIINESQESGIIGETTTGEVGHGLSPTAALIDEASRIREFQEIWEGLGPSTSARIANSTHKGPVFFSKVVKSGKTRVVRLPWWEHPLMGQGRRRERDPLTDKVRIVSPFYLAECDRAVSKREIAENLDMNPAGSGLSFFDDDVLLRQLDRAEARPVLYAGDLECLAGEEIGRDKAIMTGDVRRFAWVDRPPHTPAARWKIWCDLIEDRSTGTWRPLQTRTYIFGIDISAGVEASNSVISVFCKETGEKVAEYATAQVGPEEFARVVAMAGWWWGGARGCALAVPEANGSGGQVFIATLRKLRYPWIFRDKDDGKMMSEAKVQYGWTSTASAKESLLEWYRGALARDDFLNFSPLALNEAREYVYFENGTPGPAGLEAESAVARKVHGDRVIADGLAWYGSLRMGTSKPPAPPPPPGSAARRIWEAKRKDQRKR